jgi:hypothetical protein
MEALGVVENAGNRGDGTGGGGADRLIPVSRPIGEICGLSEEQGGKKK